MRRKQRVRRLVIFRPGFISNVMTSQLDRTQPPQPRCLPPLNVMSPSSGPAYELVASTDDLHNQGTKPQSTRSLRSLYKLFALSAALCLVALGSYKLGQWSVARDQLPVQAEPTYSSQPASPTSAIPPILPTLPEHIQDDTSNSPAPPSNNTDDSMSYGKKFSVG
jgi:hypothetical protein